MICTYVYQAFELNATDYLLKPVRLEQLLRALSKAHSLSVVMLQFLRTALAKPRMHLSVNEKDRIVLIRWRRFWT